jgi:hypothetical protein
MCGLDSICVDAIEDGWMDVLWMWRKKEEREGQVNKQQKGSIKRWLHEGMQARVTRSLRPTWES